MSLKSAIIRESNLKTLLCDHWHRGVLKTTKLLKSGLKQANSQISLQFEKQF